MGTIREGLREERRPLLTASVVGDRKSTRLNSSHTVIYTLSLHDALPICPLRSLSYCRGHATNGDNPRGPSGGAETTFNCFSCWRSEEHTSELQSHRDLHSFPTRRSSDLSFAFPELLPRPRHKWGQSARAFGRSGDHF